jgi:hypothetical protein
MMHILQMWSASTIAGSAMLPTFIYCDAFRSCSDYPGNRLGPVGITAKPDFACEYEPVIKSGESYRPTLQSGQYLLRMYHKIAGEYFPQPFVTFESVPKHQMGLYVRGIERRTRDLCTPVHSSHLGNQADL